MDFKNKIFWISSYPKSGNTWMRAILAGLFFTNDGKFNFNLLNQMSSVEKYNFYKFVKDINKKDYKNLKEIEILSKYWIEAQKRLITKDKSVFLKTHNANISINNYAFSNPDISMGLIYLIRNPLDICISYSKHLGISVDETIKFMISDKTLTFFIDSKKNRYPVPLGRWDTHIKSWQKFDVPKIFIKYEDLLSKTSYMLEKILDYFEKEFNISTNNKEIKLTNIKDTTKFEAMRDYEKKHGFNEAQKNIVFFRSAQKDQWKKILTKNQKDRIINEFGLLMTEHNYI